MLCFGLNNIKMMIIAMGTLLYSCANSAGVIFGPGMDQLPSFLRNENEDDPGISPKEIIILVVFASAVLLIYCFFLDKILIVQRFMMLFAGIKWIASTIWYWVKLILPHSICMYVTIGIAVVMNSLWFFTEHWLVTSFVTFCLCVDMPKLIKIDTLQTILVLAGAFLTYDVWWVFLAPNIGGTSPMEKAAIGAAPHLPISFSLPTKGSVNLIGGGDIAIPSLVVSFFMRFDQYHNSNLFLVSYIGYGVGVFVSTIAVEIMHRGQPALLWIFPSILIPTLITAALQGHIKELWRVGATNPNERPVPVETDEIRIEVDSFQEDSEGRRTEEEEPKEEQNTDRSEEDRNDE